MLLEIFCLYIKVFNKSLQINGQQLYFSYVGCLTWKLNIEINLLAKKFRLQGTLADYYQLFSPGLASFLWSVGVFWQMNCILRRKERLCDILYSKYCLWSSIFENALVVSVILRCRSEKNYVHPIMLLPYGSTKYLNRTV